MYALRQWSVRNARVLEWVYEYFEGFMMALHPLWILIGYDRIEGPICATERRVKAVLFDCQMCGYCVLSQTGMSCPMNCPKELRNGPCGGVRENGFCEVKPQMRCVWVDAWEGSGRMRDGSGIQRVQSPLAQGLRGRSAWLREVREKRDLGFFGTAGQYGGN
jgi:hypothetical protein